MAIRHTVTVFIQAAKRFVKFTDPEKWQILTTLQRQADRKPRLFQGTTNMGQLFFGNTVTGQYCTLTPLQVRHPFFQTLQLLNHRQGLLANTGTGEYLHPPPGYRVQAVETAALRQVLPCIINTDLLMGFHTIFIMANYAIGSADNMTGRSIVLHQVMSLRLIILFKLSYVFDAGLTKTINTLIIITHGHYAQFLLTLFQGTSGNGRDHLILPGINILILIHQDMFKTCQQTLPGLIPENARQQGFTFQQCCCPGNQLIKIKDIILLFAGGRTAISTNIRGLKAGAGQTHSQAMKGLHRHFPGFPAQ